MIAISILIFLQILLMTFLCRIKLLSLFYQGLYRKPRISWNFFIKNKILDLFLNHLCNYFLFLAMIKYKRCILCSKIIALPVFSCWIMEGEEMANKLLVRYYFWVESYMKYLDVSCLSGTDLAICWVLRSIWIRTHKTNGVT